MRKREREREKHEKRDRKREREKQKMRGEMRTSREETGRRGGVFQCAFLLISSSTWQPG